MTTYGTIPTESPSSNLQFLSHAKEQIQTGLGTRRPWKEMIQLHSINVPTTFLDSMQRIRTNAAFFRMNYAIIILFILFCSLLWHPISLIVFIFMMIAWLFLYFLRDEPLTLFGFVIDDRKLMVFLLITTVVGLFFTNVTDNILIGLSIGVVIVLVHGSLRDTDDLFFVNDEEGFGSAALFRGKNVEPTPLKDAASSSFSLS